MSSRNYRIVKTGAGVSVYEVHYDSQGRPLRRSNTPMLDAHSDSVCGLVDHLESIQLAFEKPVVNDEDIFKD